MVSTEMVYSMVKDAAKVNVVSRDGAPTDMLSEFVDESGNVYLLHHFSVRWGIFVEVQSVENVGDGDRLTLKYCLQLHKILIVELPQDNNSASHF